MKILLLIFALACTAMGQTRCPGSYHVVGTGCYTFPETVSSWIEASTLCQFSGGYLANIDSEAEQTALKTYHDANFPGVSYRQIGATDMVSADTWRWVPSGSTVIFESWEAGEPAVSSTENCATWAPGGNYWNTLSCCTLFSDIMPLCEADPL